MNENLGLRVEMCDNGAGYMVGWLVHDNGVRRRASEEEVRLWDALQAALAKLPAKAGGRKP